MYIQTNVAIYWDIKYNLFNKYHFVGATLCGRPLHYVLDNVSMHIKGRERIECVPRQDEGISPYRSYMIYEAIAFLPLQ